MLSGAAATFVGTDTATRGYWATAYGAEGYYVPFGNQSQPSFASVSTSGTLAGANNGPTSDPRALTVTPSVTGERTSSIWYGPDFSFNIHINVSDGLTHRVALYALDWQELGYTERVTAIDTGTGAALDTRDLAGFQQGTYLAWDVSGDVTLRVTGTSAYGIAIVGGLFFGGPMITDAAPPAPAPVAAPAAASFVGTDTTTQGNWPAAYGADGYEMAHGPTNPPGYATTSFSYHGNDAWATSSTDPRAMVMPPGVPGGGLAGVWYQSAFSTDVHLTDGQSHRVALYLLDWDGQNRSERVDVIDDATGTVLDTRTASGFQNGTYLVWNLRGSVTLAFNGLNPQNGGSSAVLSGLFFDTEVTPPAPATPIISSAPSASPAMVTGTTTGLSVAATVDGDPSNLTYTWSVESMPTGAFAPEFSDNGTATAGAVTATFSQAGDYTFLLTADNRGAVATGEVTVTVQQTATTIVVSPPAAIVHNGSLTQFTANAEDQFGQQVQTPPSFTWSLSGGIGAVDESGLYTAPSVGSGEAEVEASTGDITAKLAVRVTSGNYNNQHIGTWFSGLTYEQIVSRQYKDAKFSGDPGFPVMVVSGGGLGHNYIAAPSSPPGYGSVIGTGEGQITMDHPIYVDFAVPVENLKFNWGVWGYTPMAPTYLKQAEVNVFVNGSLSTTVPLVPTDTHGPNSQPSG